MTRAVHLVISGRVQGVSFRANTQRTAKQLGLAGWVRNRADGCVEAWAEGPDAAIKDFVTWCHRGPTFAVVDTVDVHSEEPRGLDGFAIQR